MLKFGLGRKVWAFFLFFSLLFLVIGYQAAERAGLFVGLLVALFFHWVLNQIDEHPLDAIFHPRQLEGEDPWLLNRRCGELAKAVGLAPPKVLLASHGSLFAYVIVEPFGDKKLVLSTALLDRLAPAELDALLVGLLCFARRAGTFWYGVCYIFSQMILALSLRLDRLVPLKGRNPFTQLVRPLVALIQRLGFPRRSFYEVDDESSQILAHRIPLAHALWKLDHSTSVSPLGLPPCSETFFVVSPGRLQYAWGAAHPPVAERVRKLVGTFPI